MGSSGGNVSAQDRFKNSKGISSDQFFGRDVYAENNTEEHRNNLNKFANAGAISSDAYFNKAPVHQHTNSHSDSTIDNDAVDFFAEIGTKFASDIQSVVDKTKEQFF